MIFDTHAHYDDESYRVDRDEVLDALGQGGFTITNVGSSLEGSIESVLMSNDYPFIYAAVGLHPDYPASWDEDTREKLIKLSAQPKCVAIGEIGLDYYYEVPDREVQKVAFREQLALAKELEKPVIIHSRDAAKDTLNFIKDSGIREQGGIMHCFSYSPEVALECLMYGFYIGVGGALTFKNARKLPEVVELCPLERLVIETDCPYMAPVPHRGMRNDTRYLSYVCSRIAEIKKISVEEVERITCENAMRVYRIEKL